MGSILIGNPDKKLSFADALQSALQWTQGGGRIDSILIEGAVDTHGLECFSGLTSQVALRSCSGPLSITKLPVSTTFLYVEATCVVSDVTGVSGVGQVEVDDASLTTDFSPLMGAWYVWINGDVSLESIAPHVTEATVLVLGVNASTLVPLNTAKAQYLWIQGAGLHDIGAYQPPATLTCFKIQLDPAATSEEQNAVVARLCSSTRSAPECPQYNCCWDPYFFPPKASGQN